MNEMDLKFNKIVIFFLSVARIPATSSQTLEHPDAAILGHFANCILERITTSTPSFR